MVELVELRVPVPQNEHASSRSYVSFVCLYPISHPAGGVQVRYKAWNLLSDGLKAIFRTGESNLDALNTVDLGPKRLLVSEPASQT